MALRNIREMGEEVLNKVKSLGLQFKTVEE